MMPRHRARRGHATELVVVEGSTRGPDGLPLSPFARFAARIANPELRRLDAIAQLCAIGADGGSILVAPDGGIAVRDAEGVLREVPTTRLLCPGCENPACRTGGCQGGPR